MQCPNEKCRNDEAYWYQLQIRSADEPMTAFYKVSNRSCNMCYRGCVLMFNGVRNAQGSGENDTAVCICIYGRLGASIAFDSYHLGTPHRVHVSIKICHGKHLILLDAGAKYGPIMQEAVGPSATRSRRPPRFRRHSPSARSRPRPWFSA